MNFLCQSGRSINHDKRGVFKLMWRLIFLMFGLILFFVKDLGAEPVKITVSKNTEFARIVFEWPQRATHDFSLNDRTIRIRFGRKAEAPFLQDDQVECPACRPCANGSGLKWLTK